MPIPMRVLQGGDVSQTELETLDGVTAGTVTASKAVVVDSSKNIATFGTVGAAATTITSASASALTVGPSGATNPALKIDASTSSMAAGLSVTGATAAGNVAVAVISSGSNANLLINAKGSGTIGIGSVSTGAVTITPATTVTGAVTPTGGIVAAGGFTASGRLCHTGGVPALASTDGTNATPSATETYIAEVFVPANCTLTGIAIFNGATVGTDKHFVALADSTGTVVAASAGAGVTTSGADAYQRVAFTGTYAAKGPATYYVCLQMNGTTDRYNAHPIGNFGASKGTGTVFGTLASVTPPTTFTADLGPIASLY